ncbi:MAG TPA: hypothetical protein VNA04_12530 [Thermoanaerobaculia bacterium]|nr:hypothetical protein [Thermoanaerobaculia bacterium]
MCVRHRSSFIPAFLALAVLLSAGGCTVTNTPPPVVVPLPPSPVVPVPPQPHSQPDRQFTSRGEQISYEVERYRREIRCTNGNGSKGSPMICVDNVTTTPDPYVARVWDFEAEGGFKTNRPVVVHWFTRRTANLKITFQQTSCVTPPICDKMGHCNAQVLPLDEGEALRTCKYTVTIDGQTLEHKSPELGVNPCCN